MFPSPKIPVHLFCLHHLPYLPQSVCEVRGWSEVTGGRCFLPSFEDDCKDEGRNSGKGKACFSAEAGCFTREATITSSRCWPQSGSSSGNGSSLSNPPLRPQNLNVELTPHLVKAALNFSPTTHFATCLSDQTELCLFKRSLQSIFTQ